MKKNSATLRVFLAVSMLLVTATTATANALLDFSGSLRSFRANFTQTVYDADSVVLQESAGTVVLARPGRFKWTYDVPANQIIVADGLTLWVYDEEIKQVTRQPQSTTLGSAPIGLLSGQRDIESEFVITELGKKDDLDWFQLQPLVSDTDFNQIFIALKDDGLSAMELRDNFDQATQILFSKFEKNIGIGAEQFQFVVPDGVDVVGEEGVEQNPDNLQTDNLSQDDLVTGESEVGSNESAANGASAGPVPNSDDELLGDGPLGDENSTVEPVTDVVPEETDTANPSREITFEERKISN